MRILVTEPVDSEAIQLLKSKHEVDVKSVTPDELLGIIPDYDALIVRSKTKVTKQVFDKGGKLKVVSMAGVGVDHIDVAYATAIKKPVCNAPTASTYSVAELTIGLIVSLMRFIPRADKGTKDGRWEKNTLLGTELYGKTMGIIGIGRIGKQVSLRAKAMGLHVLAYDPYVTKETMAEYGAHKVELEELLTRSDIVTIHTVLSPETKGMVDLDKLKRMKRTAILVNDARGKIVVQGDLVKALNEGIIAGAALDVYEDEPPKDSPLLKMQNVVLTPHIGASTNEGQKKAGMVVAQDVLKVLGGQRPDFPVNPEIYPS